MCNNNQVSCGYDSADAAYIFEGLSNLRKKAIQRTDKSRWYPSSKTCSSCQHKLEKLALSVRGWACPHCGAAHDRDHNAAKNLLAEGVASLARVNPGDLRVDGADVNAPRETRTGQLTNVPSRRRAAVS